MVQSVRRCPTHRQSCSCTKRRPVGSWHRRELLPHDVRPSPPDKASLQHLLRCCAGVIAVKGDVTAIWGLLTSSYLNVLLLSVPLGYLAHALNWAPLLRFSLVIPDTPSL